MAGRPSRDRRLRHPPDGRLYFTYSHLRVDRSTADANATLHVTADVTNHGERAGATVPQLYVSTPFEPASAQRPLKRLAAFQKVTVAPHETARVSFTVPVPDFTFYDEAAKRYTVDPGTYELRLASSSADSAIAARASVRVGGHAAAHAVGRHRQARPVRRRRP